MLIRFLRGFSEQIIAFWKLRASARLAPLLSVVRIGGLAIAAIALWSFATLAEEVLEQETRTFDTNILLALKKIHTPLLDQVMIAFTSFGEPVVLFVVSLILGVGLLVLKRQAEAITLAVAAGGAGVLNYLLKDLFARDRPVLWDRVVDVRHYSFPSGHATMSLVLYGLIGYLLASQFGRWRGLIFGTTLFIIAIIGFSRLYLGVHWPTDVVGGYASGLVWLIACILSLEVGRSRSFDSGSSNKEAT